MKVAILSSIAWRTPPQNYGPWELITDNIAEGLHARGIDVTVFAAGNSNTKCKLEAVCERPYGEDSSMDPKVWECLHISHLMEHAWQFDIIHNNYDFLPLTYSGLIETPMITTIHGFSSPQIVPVYKKYNSKTSYISISNADRHPELNYLRTIYHGIDPEGFTFRERKQKYLLYFGRIHGDKGAHIAIEIAAMTGYPLSMAGPIQDEDYFKATIAPHIDNEQVTYLGNADPVLRDELLGNALALLHPVCFEEPFGLSVAEAMMCGTPVIAFARGSMPELILEGKTGFLVKNNFEAAAAVQQLDRINPHTCREHAIRKFGRERMVDDYLEAYDSVLNTW